MQNKKTLGIVLVMLIALILVVILLVINFDGVEKVHTLPFNITVTFGRDVNTEKNFCWFTNKDMSDSYIQYMEYTNGNFDVSKAVEVKADSEKTAIKYPAKKIMNEDTSEMKEKHLNRHRVYLTGLKSGTKYLYRLGNDKYFSDVYSFTTPDSNKEFGFIIVADSQGYTKSEFEYYSKVLRKANNMYPDSEFYVHLGDFVEDSSNGLHWNYVLTNPSDIMTNNTFVPVAGNKDDMELFEYFTLGSKYDTTSMATGWYSFDYKDIHFVVLNTSGNGSLSKKQLSWLNDDLGKNSSKRTLVLTHKAPYTNANHADDKEIIELKEQLLPVFDKYGVIAVLQGHDHYYFRSEPIYEGLVGQYSLNSVNLDGDTVDLYSDIRGTVYLINSSSGNKQYDKSFRVLDNIYASKSFNCKRPTFTYCVVSDNSIVFRTYEVNVTTGTAKLIDSFGLSS